MTERATRALEVHQRLLKAYKDRPLVPRREPMHELISTMLSHRTTGANEELAYNRMRERFGSWEAVRDADVDALTDAIAPSNFPGAKAPNIKKTLARIIEERGEANIDFLADMTLEEGMIYLTSLPGVGLKTASLVLLFAFAKAILPVDTHVHRVSGRLGLIGGKVTAEKAHGLLLELLPPEPPLLYNFHHNMLRHGQLVCIWGTPRCEKCVLTDLCDYYQENRKGEKEGRGERR